MTHSDSAFQNEVNAIRSSKVLGEKSRLSALFEYLVSHGDQMPPLSENVVAAEVFGKRDFTGDKDNASVRVYIHRLRKRLDEYYASQETGDREYRLSLPVGAYRLVLIEQSIAGQPAGRSYRSYRVGAAILVVNIALWLAFILPDHSARPEGVLTPLLESADRPITILVGDYYLFGQLSPTNEVTRLVRDFEVNSAANRERLYPGGVDVGLTYLPPSAAQALGSILPLVDRAGRSFRVLKVSDANSDVFKSGDVIYLGLLSGMGFIQPQVFENSIYAPGGNYDEVINVRTGAYYASSEAAGLMNGTTYKDYGYFSFKRFSTDNFLLVVAGTRDTGLRGMAELLSGTRALPGFENLQNRDRFEALIEIEGQQQANIITTLLDAE